LSFFEELKRRNVFRVAIGYIITAWLLLQVVDLVLDNINAPDWVIQVFMLALAIGFPLAVFFAWAFEMTPEGLKRESEVDRSQSITSQTGKKLNVTIIVVMALALGYFAYDKFVLSPNRDAALVEATTQAMTEQAASDEVSTESDKSIAVLPFVNMSDDASNEYFSDGISEEILNVLARVKDLKVAGRTSSFAFKGDNQDLRQIGDALGVQHILEGSVRKSGNTVRITAQLIQVKDGFHLWSDTYDRELDNVFAIQDEIAQAILTELKATLLGDEQIASTQTETAAYENYLLARQRIYERNEASLNRAVGLLNEAIEVDPNYAPAYAQLGIATMLLSDENYGSLPNSEAGEKALSLVEHGLALDPQLPEAMAAKGLYLYNFALNSVEAIDWLQRALAINPNLTNASIWLALAMELNGDIQGAMRIYETANERDPFNPVAQNNLVVSYSVTGQYERGFALLERARSVTGTTPLILKSGADLKLLQGKLADGVALAEQAYAAQPLNNPGMLVLGFSYLAVLGIDQALEINTPRVRILALHQQGRTEEASILGFEQAAAGRVWPELFQVLVENGEYARLVEFVESRWPDLAAFQAIYPEREGYGSPMMAFIAESYSRLGKESQFDDAMARLNTSLEHQLNQGANNPFFHFSRAVYAMLAGDQEAAIDRLEVAFARGAGFNIKDPRAWPVFAPLNGDPRYEKAKKGLVEYINAERSKLGWEPVSI
jgi:TolB-like protein